MGVQPDIVFGRGGGRELRLDLFTPAPEKSLRTAVLQLHFGGWRMGDRKMLRPRSEKLSALGFTCCAVEYRLVPESLWPAQLHDVKAAIRWVRVHAEELGVEPNRIVLQGYSAGGHLALMAAGTPGKPEFEGEGGHPGISTAVAAVMAFYPPTALFVDPDSAAFGDQYPPSDVDEWNRRLRAGNGFPSWLLLGHHATDEETRQASPFSYISPRFPPTFLVHGTADALSFQMSVRFHQALLDAGVMCDLHLFGGQPHQFDGGKSFLEITQQEAALFFRRTVCEPGLVAKEFREAVEALAMEAQLPADQALRYVQHPNLASHEQ
jgi:acetyl esterase/lipase